MDREYVLVIGSAMLEISGKSPDRIRTGRRQFGHVHCSVSGVARNIAENLARLEIETFLLSAIGEDDFGQHLVEQSSGAGIHCNHILRVSGAQTAASLILVQSQDKTTRLDDLAIMEYLDSDYLIEHEWLFEQAALIVIDATLQEEGLIPCLNWRSRHDVRVCADPTSRSWQTASASTYRNLYLIVPNASETASLCDLDEPATERDQAISTAQHLVNLGANVARRDLGRTRTRLCDSSGGG